jgi:hypothetical protein
LLKFQSSLSRNDRERELSRIGANREINGEVNWELPEGSEEDKVAMAISEREKFIKQVQKGLPPGLGQLIFYRTINT